MKRGLHHLHIRKRMSDGKDIHPYPSPKKSIAILDKIVLYLAFIAPWFEIPQLLQIYINHSAKDVSPITWGFFAFMSVPWFIYGLVHKEKPIIVLYALWFLIDTSIVIGILIFN